MEELPYCRNGEHGFVSRKRDSLYILNPETGACKRVTEPFFQVDTYCIDGDIIFLMEAAIELKCACFRNFGVTGSRTAACAVFITVDATICGDWLCGMVG